MSKWKLYNLYKISNLGDLFLSRTKSGQFFSENSNEDQPAVICSLEVKVATFLFTFYSWLSSFTVLINDGLQKLSETMLCILLDRYFACLQLLLHEPDKVITLSPVARFRKMFREATPLENFSTLSTVALNLPFSCGGEDHTKRTILA